jgi:type II secretory pathway component PulF
MDLITEPILIIITLAMVGVIFLKFLPKHGGEESFRTIMYVGILFTLTFLAWGSSPSVDGLLLIGIVFIGLLVELYKSNKAILSRKEKDDLILRWELALSYAISKGDRYNIQQTFNAAQRIIIKLDEKRLVKLYKIVSNQEIIKSRWKDE